MNTITIIKQDYQGIEIHRYSGQLIEQLPGELKIEAYFDWQEIAVEGIVLNKGDRFIESYFEQRWYNIFEIHDRSNDHLKAWYCNICFPPEISKGFISFRDLALDLLVYPDGSHIVLDQDEFESLLITPDVRSEALNALQELQELFK